MKRNKFSLSHHKLAGADMGILYPVGWVETLPGDSFQHSTSVLLRTTPLNTPVMHPVKVRVHHWFVPYRLIWDDFQNFITGGPDGLDASAYPYITGHVTTGFVQGELGDHLGVPPAVASLQVSALPFRAYALIFNEFYRDEDLTTASTLSTASGSDVTTQITLRAIAWEKDYFTTARPWTQKGTAVTLPLGTTAPVVSNNADPTITGTGFSNVKINARQTELDLSANASPTGGNNPIHWGNVTGLETDLSSATAVNINTLRTALALQRFEEWRARFGSRYSEYLRALGVRSSDARLQRPEYLAGGSQTIQFSEVLQTSPQITEGSSEPTGVGSLLGHGIAAMRSNRYRRFFEEHGIVMTLLSVRPKTIYTQGLFRKWNRRTKFDFWQPQYEHIGQQAIENREVDATHGTLTGVFGYQDRYDEYRREESYVSGDFRTTENTWHMGRIFTALPALNSTFVGCNPTTRIFQSYTNDTLLLMINHSIQARRPLSDKASPMTF